MAFKKSKVSKDIYQIVTDKIIASLETGTPRWVKGWNGTSQGMPKNIDSGKYYRGINILLLDGEDYSSNLWGTYKQMQDKGRQVKKGEKSTMGVFFKVMSYEDADSGEKKKFPLIRSFSLFNVEQTDGPEIEKPARLGEVERNKAADAFIAATGAKVTSGEPMYMPGPDAIKMPNIEMFKKSDEYYSTHFHELTHWTGAKHRLARTFGKRFGDDAYAVEELVAEMGAAFTCARHDIDNHLQHSSYLASWLRVLKADKRAIVTAAARASDAADYLAAFGEEQKKAA